MERRDLDDLDLNPHWDRVSEEYADARIHEHISKFEDERQRTGLRNVDKALRDIDAPAGLRLHYVSTLAHLGRKGMDGEEHRAQDVERSLDSVDVPKDEHEIGREK